MTSANSSLGHTSTSWDTIARLNRDGCILSVLSGNGQSSALFQADVVGKHLLEAGLPAEVAHRVQQHVQAAFSSREPLSFDFDVPGTVAMTRRATPAGMKDSCGPAASVGDRILEGEICSYAAVVVVERSPRARSGETVLLIVRDVTSERRAQETQNIFEQQLTLLIEASAALLATPHSEKVLRTIVGLAQRFVAADAHSVWGSDSAGNWSMLSSAGLSDAYLRHATIASGSATPPLSAPLVAPDVYASPALRWRREGYAEEGIRSLLVIPLLVHNEPSGTVAFYWRAPHAISEGEIRIGQALANLAAAALGTVHLYEREIESRQRAERSEQRSAFLAQAGALISSSLDFQTTLANMARLAVPGFADWCSIDVLDEKGRIQRVAIQHSNPAMLVLAEEYRQKYPPRDTDITRTVLHSGQAAMVDRITADMLAGAALDAEHLDYLLKLGIASLIVVPLIAPSGDSLGVLTFVRSDLARTYSSEDLQIAEEVGRRAGTAIAHARLYGDVRASEERLRLAVSAAGLGVWERDLDTGELTASERCKINVGADPNKPLSYEDLVSRIHKDDVAPWMAATQAARETGEAFETEYRIRWPDGSLHTVLSYGRVLPADPGQPRKVVGVTLDVAERRASLVREQSARRTAELLNSIGPILLSQLGLDRLVQDITDLAAMLVGAEFGVLVYDFAPADLTRGEASHPPAVGLSSGGQRLASADPGFNNWLGSLTLDVAAQSGEVAAGSSFGASLLSVPVRSSSGELLGSLLLGHRSAGAFDEEHERLAKGIAAQGAIALDNARLFEESRRAREALQHSNEELRRANEDLNQFAYSASHDLQEPLRMVAVYSQMLQRKYAGTLDERGAEYLRYTIQGSQRMEMLVKDLLAYAQAAAASTEDVPLSDTDNLMRRVLENLQASIDESGAIVHISQLPAVRMNAIHLLQVMQNLIGNAIKYRKPDQSPEIWISGETAGAMATIRIRDNGIGVPEEYRKHIFGIFRRLHNSDQYSGTGIGLAICQRLIERYGGKIWVDSQSGEGAEFSFSLPAI